MATLKELIADVAAAAGVSDSDIIVVSVDYTLGTLRLEVDNLELDPDEGEEEDVDDDLDESDDE